MSNYYCPHCKEAVIDNGHNSAHTCKKGAYILPNEGGKGYSCLCGATYEVYMCRCTEGCGENNLIDVKGNLIKNKYLQEAKNNYLKNLNKTI